jgi:hypothetical protein
MTGKANNFFQNILESYTQDYAKIKALLDRKFCLEQGFYPSFQDLLDEIKFRRL